MRKMLLAAAVLLSVMSGSAVASAHVQTHLYWLSGWNDYSKKAHDEGTFTYDYDYDYGVTGYVDPNGGGDDFQFQKFNLSGMAASDPTNTLWGPFKTWADHVPTQGKTNWSVFCDEIEATDPLSVTEVTVWTNMPYGTEITSNVWLYGGGCYNPDDTTGWDYYTVLDY